MLLNECVVCDGMFKNTEEHPGCICPDCKSEMETVRLEESIEQFWTEIEKIISRNKGT